MIAGKELGFFILTDTMMPKTGEKAIDDVRCGNGSGDSKVFDVFKRLYKA